MQLKKTNIIALTLLSTLFLLIIGCAPSTRYLKETRYYVAPPEMASQTKQGITIQMEYLNSQDLQVNPLYQQNVLKAGLLTTKAEELSEMSTFVNPFEEKLTFNVKITNNTDHILRMRDARVYFVSSTSMDNPIQPYIKQTLVQDVGSHPGVLSHRNRSLPYESAIGDSWEQAQIKIINSNSLKFINDVGMEILPKFSVSGILCFPVNTSAAVAVDGKVSFFDVTTKVDKAGNPLEKEQFDFAIKPSSKYYKIVGKQKSEISETEYSAAKK